MIEVWHAFIKAIELIVSLDLEVMEIAGRSLWISATSVILASLICLPLGGLIHFYRFPGKRVLINVIQTLFSIPSVCIGLLVFVLFSRAGPIGGLNLLFTPTTMVIGHMMLITPILLGLTISALSGVDKAIKDTALSLGASDFQAVIIISKEARFAIVAAIIMGFGRAVSELGIALMVGGNIRGFTRVLTSAIALESQKGELEMAIALGIILLSLSFIVNVVLNRIQQR